MLPHNSLSFITNDVKGIQSSKKRLKLMQYFKDKRRSLVYYFYKGLTLTAKSNKNGKKTLKVQLFFSWKAKFLWRLNCLLWNRNVYC